MTWLRPVDRTCGTLTLSAGTLSCLAHHGTPLSKRCPTTTALERTIAQAGTTQAFQYEEPAREVGIDHDALSANLHKEAGVANEGDAEFSVGGEAGRVSLTVARSDGGVAHQTPELGGAFAEGRIAKRLLNHPATEPEGWTGSSSAP